jgi:hypothetical protein
MDRSVKTLACGRAGICQFCGEHFSLVQRFLSGAIQIPTEGGVIGMKPEAVWIEFGFRRRRIQKSKASLARMPARRAKRYTCVCASAGSR